MTGNREGCGNGPTYVWRRIMAFGKFHFGAVAVVLAMVARLGWAVMPENITQAEMALIPPYCAYTQGFKLGGSFVAPSEGAKRWIAAMGGGDCFWHMHHYCTALINLRRAEKATLSEHEKGTLRGAALGDLWYVPKNCPEDFVLLPEIYTWIGRTEIKNRAPDKANAAFAKARELKPDYWPAYFHWAEYLRSAGQRAEALEVVRAGLRRAPDVKTLKSLYSTLGGKDTDLPLPLENKATDEAPARE